MYGIKIASLAFLASAVVAQNLPGCANSCVTNYNGCNQFDIACICGSSAWIAGLACCVANVCNAQEQEETIQFANTICAAAGVTTLPQTATCASGAASSYSTGAPTVSVALSSVLAVATSVSAASNTGAVVSTSTPSVTASVTRASTNSAAAAATTSGAANINKAGALGLGAFIAVAAAL